MSPDLEEALKWFRSAAEQGAPRAMVELAKMYNRGLGTPQDQVECYAWLAVAEAYDDEEARSYLKAAPRNYLEENMDAIEARVEELFELVEFAEGEQSPGTGQIIEHIWTRLVSKACDPDVHEE